MTIGAASVLSGCALLYPELYGIDEDWQVGPVGRYQSGSARVSLSGGTEEERELSLSSGGHTGGFGSEAIFRDDEGWALTIMVYGPEPMPYLESSAGSLTIHRAIRGHWAASDWDASCELVVTQSDDKVLVGTASCTGMRWMDQIETSMAMGGLPIVEGEASFDAEVSFEAFAQSPRPSPGAPSADAASA